MVLGARSRSLTSETRSALPGSFAELSAGVTHYEVRGDPAGHPVVLIHGNAAPMATWDRTIGPLADAGFHVLRYDLFGHGLSDRPDLPNYDRELYDTQLGELLDGLDIPRPVRIVGSSQGGSIGACFAAEHPGDVDRLALLAPFVDDFPGSDGALFRLLKTPMVGGAILRLAKDGALADISDAMVSPRERAELQPKVLEQFRYHGKRRAILANLRGDALTDATDCYRRVAEQEIATLLTYGDRDQRLPRESIDLLRELVPGIEYHEFEGAGHLAHYEIADQMNRLLIRFLAD